MNILNKIWDGTSVYQEPICFTTNVCGEEIGGHLLYKPSKIHSITSNDGNTIYTEGKDYIVHGQNIVRLADSSMPYLNRDVYCKPFTGNPETAWVRLPGGREYIDVVDSINNYQMLVTYEHTGKWTGFTPHNVLRGLPNSCKLLASPVFNLVFYGDSITAGWEASGCDEQAVDMVTLMDYHVKINHTPFMPAWAELVTASLREMYPHCKISKTNRAAGGSTTGWGAQNAAHLVNPCIPDLVILGFGMNSMWDTAEKYGQEISSIIENIRAEHPQCEFLLVSPMVPNLEIGGFQRNYLVPQQEKLYEIAANYDGVAVAPVHSVFQSLISMGKEYIELTGNCINHPNDFSIRIYAQTILTALGI